MKSALTLVVLFIISSVPTVVGAFGSMDQEYYTLYSGTGIYIPTGVFDGRNTWHVENELRDAIGAAVHDDKLRIYFLGQVNSTERKMYFIETESSDIGEGWGAPVECDTSLMSVFHHNGWKGTRNEGGHLVKYESGDGIHWEHVGTAFTEGTIDGKGNTFYDENLDRYVHYGRVRGNKSEAAGGWQG